MSSSLVPAFLVRQAMRAVRDHVCASALAMLCADGRLMAVVALLWIVRLCRTEPPVQRATIYIYIHTYTHARAHAHTHMHACTHTHTHTHTHTQARTHTRTHTYM
jgi:ABC-type nickel/cobalt efflux system permease component RcnA